MEDILLTKSGDILILSTIKKNNSIKLQWQYSDCSAIKLSMMFKSFKQIEKPKNAIRIQFQIGQSEEYSSDAKVIEKRKCISQMILIRFKTVFGELEYRSTLGSEFEKIKHDILFDQNTKNYAELYAKKAIQDILPNAKIIATPYAKRTNSGYKQVMKISVYDEDILLLEYDVE